MMKFTFNGTEYKIVFQHNRPDSFVVSNDGLGPFIEDLTRPQGDRGIAAFAVGLEDAAKHLAQWLNKRALKRERRSTTCTIYRQVVTGIRPHPLMENPSVTEWRLFVDATATYNPADAKAGLPWSKEQGRVESLVQAVSAAYDKFPSLTDGQRFADAVVQAYRGRKDAPAAPAAKPVPTEDPITTSDLEEATIQMLADVFGVRAPLIRHLSQAFQPQPDLRGGSGLPISDNVNRGFTNGGRPAPKFPFVPGATFPQHWSGVPHVVPATPEEEAMAAEHVVQPEQLTVVEISGDTPEEMMANLKKFLKIA